MMNKKVIVIGDGGHAKIVIDILQSMKTYEILGVTSFNQDREELYGFPVLGNDEILETYYKKGIKNLALGIGGFKDNYRRTNVYEQMLAKGFCFVNAIHPSVIIGSNVKIGQGGVIFPGVVINTGSEIGNNVIIATGSTIDHETAIHDNCLISAGVTIGANTTIGRGTLCALGSKVTSGLTIGENSLIAAGAVVVNDIPDNSRVFGIPAKPKNK